MRGGWLVLLGVVCGCGRIGFEVTADTQDGFRYARPRAIYLHNDVAPAKTIPIDDNQPLDAVPGAAFSIQPDLEALTGLSFDVTTGAIGGLPNATSPPTEYVVTATAPSGVTTARLTIRTAPGFYVRDLVDSRDSSASDDDCVGAAGRCTVRAAMEQLALFDATQRVVLLPEGTFTTPLGTLLATQPVELIGADRDSTVIDAANAHRLLDLGNLNSTIVSDLTLRRGNDASSGGCIAAKGGTVVLRDLVIESCTAADGGGGVRLGDNFDTLPMSAVIERVTFRDNVAGTDGGGLAVGTGVGGTTASITACEFTNNRASLGAALLLDHGPLTLRESLIAANRDGMAVYTQNGSIVAMVNVTIADNLGGPLGPGGLRTNNNTTLEMVNSTVVGNFCNAGCFGGAGIDQNSGGTMTIRNSIVAGNVDLGSGSIENCAGAGSITSLGNNLTDGEDSSETCFAQLAGDLFGSPVLGTLADNGGPTRTMSITPASPAYDAASAVACPAIDQRGLPRPAGSACDIGAFEAQ